MLKNLALLAASLVLFVGVCEVALRALGYSAIYQEYSKPSMLWQHDELLGWSHTPGTSDTYVGPRPFPIEFRTPIQINALGLRGPELRQASDTIRVLVTGDSRAVAFEVPWQETFGARLDALLARELSRPVQVLNAGVRGYGTDQSYLYYRERGRELAPRVVIHLHSGNDVGDNVTLHRMRRPFGKAAFGLDPSGPLELLGAPVQPYPICSEYRVSRSYQIERVDSLPQRAFCTLQILFFDHSALFTFVSSRIQRNPEFLTRLYGLGAPDVADSERAGDTPTGDAVDAGPATAHGIELTNALLRSYAEQVREDGAEFLLVSWRQILERVDTDAVVAAGGRIVLLDDAFARHERRSLSFQNDGHYNELGNRLIAQHLAPIVAELLSPQTP